MVKEAGSEVHALSAELASTTLEKVVRGSYASVPLDCDICQHIMRAFHTPYEIKYDVDLGSAADVLSKPCPAHGPFLARLKERFESNEMNMVTYTLREAHFKVEKFAKHYTVGISINVNEHNLRFNEPVELVKATSADQVERGVIPDPQWIDPSLMRKWKVCCQETHGEGCEHPLKQYRLTESIPTWLIDVHNRCLIPGRSDMRYVTLSYRWGETERPRLEKRSLAELQKPNALAKMAAGIPETIRNAIDLAQLLQEDYMWTDALCIVQDDEASKFTELMQMAAIYANSTLTIIAAEGENAAYGLPGLEGISKPRALQDRWWPFGDTEKVIRPRFPRYHSAQSPYFKRGWTFQEYLFSKRRLIFEGQMVRWECSHSAWSEDIVHSDGQESKFRCNWMDKITDTYPSLGSFGNMLHHYNERQFTYEEDVLPSLTGLFSMLSQKYEGGFLCGIPEMYFEDCLNWGRWCGDLRRRKSSGKSSASKTLTLLPSWSWIRWEGRTSGVKGNQDYLKKGRQTGPYFTIPITEWFTSSSPTDSSKRRIASKSLYEREDLKYHLNRPLPAGWTRHIQDPDSIPKKLESIGDDGKYYVHPPPSGCGSHYYTHSTCPDEEFWYPIPMLDKDKEPIIPRQTQYLFCSTHRAFLFVKASEVESPGRDRTAILRDKNEKWAGVLLLQNGGDQEQFENEGGEGVKVELVTISRGYTPNSKWQNWLPEIDHEERPKEAELYEFFNVLWIQWRDGVAYRRAHGRIEKGIWEGLELEAVELVLG